MSDLISRCELFNRLAAVKAETANEMKGAIYAVIQDMPSAKELCIGIYEPTNAEIIDAIEKKMRGVNDD